MSKNEVIYEVSYMVRRKGTKKWKHVKARNEKEAIRKSLGFAGEGFHWHVKDRVKT